MYCNPVGPVRFALRIWKMKQRKESEREKGKEGKGKEVGGERECIPLQSQTIPVCRDRERERNMKQIFRVAEIGSLTPSSSCVPSLGKRFTKLKFHKAPLGPYNNSSPLCV